MKRLQLRHHDELFSTRELALEFFSDILNPNHINSGKFGTSLYAEPMVAKYTDNNGKTQILFAIGTDTPDAPYHIIDSAEISERINDEIARAIASEATLQNNIDTEVARAKEVETTLDKKIDTEIARAQAEEARLQTVIDAEVIRATEVEATLDKKIDDNITSIISVEPSGANVLEEYALKNAKDELLGEHIRIYKDSSLVGAVTGFKGAKSVEKVNDIFVLSYDEATRDENIEYLYLIYRNEEGILKLVGIDFENFLMEAEFGDGIKVVDHVASIKIKEGEKYISVDKDGLYITNIDETISIIINEEKTRAEAAEAKLQENINAEVARATAEETKLQENINVEVARAKEVETTLDKKIDTEIARAQAEEARLQTVIDAEVIRAQAEEAKLQENINAEVVRAKEVEAEISNEIKANKLVSKDVVLDTTVSGTNLTIQTDEITITKLADAGTIYDTNIAVFGSLLKVKKVTPTSTSIKSRYELQGADGKLIGDAIELPVESALVDVRQGKLGASVDVSTGIYTEGTGDITMDFIYRLEDGNYKLVQIVVSEYFTDSHFGRGLNNQDGVVSLLEGDGNEYLVIGEDTLAVVGVNAAISKAKEEAINEVKGYSDTNVSDLKSYVDTIVETVNQNVNSNINVLNQSIETNSQSIETNSTQIDTEIKRATKKEEELQNNIDEEVARAQAEEARLQENIDETKSYVNGLDEAMDARVKVLEEIDHNKLVADAIAGVVAGAPEDLDTLKEIADWIQNDTTGAASMANDIEALKAVSADTRLKALETKVTELEAKVSNLESEIEALKNSVNAEQVKEIIKTYLSGVENEITINPSEDNSKLTIGFAEDAIFG